MLRSSSPLLSCLRSPSPRPPSVWWTYALATLALLAGALSVRAQETSASIRQGFQTPPPDCRIMMRWWWFGPAVSKPEIKRELEQMQAAGIGGAEVANLYPLRLDDPAAGFRNQPFLSDEYIDDLRYAAEQARRLGLRLDVTLGSGWPFGGPHIPVTQSAGVLRTEIEPLDETRSVPLPVVGAGESLVAAFALSSADPNHLPLSDAQLLPLPSVTGQRLQLPPDLSSAQAVLFFIASRTGMMVKRASVGADGFVLDHYDPAAVQNHLHAVGDRLLQAFPAQPPFAVFSDSLEVAGTNWTGDYLGEFRRRRGYDLLPHLPSLIGDAGPDTISIRHDWGKTLSELVVDRYFVPVQQWAHTHGTRLRSQNYGNPPVTLDSYRYVDLIEGEGKASPLMWRHFSDTRWAVSAAHLLNQSVVSSETWTWLHSPAFRATPLDLKSEADLHFLQGVNQLVGHGWPYSPPDEPEPGNRMYAAAALNAHNPWFFVMPDLAAYLQRVSYALRLGKPVANVAVLMPNDDAFASFYAPQSLPSTANPATGTRAPGLGGSRPPSAPPAASQGYTSGPSAWGNVDEDASIGAIVGDELIGTVLDVGFSLDFVDPAMIERDGVTHLVLILPHMHRIDLATYRRIEAFSAGKGIVIALGAAPSMGPGLLEQKTQNAEIQAISQRLFASPAHPGYLVANETELASVLAQFGQPEVRFAQHQSLIGFLHRRLPDGDLYFIANTANTPQHLDASFAGHTRAAEWWDPFTGETSPVPDPDHIDLTLEPYGSRLLVFSTHAAAARKRQPAAPGPPVSIDLSSDWTVRFGDSRATPVHTLRPWGELPAARFFSGIMDYEKSVTLTSAQIAAPLMLDFGPVKPEPIGGAPGEIVRTRAYLDTPIRDAAEVWVNGRRVGSVWHPPYSIKISRNLHAGTNTLRVRVANTAINELAGQKLPDYRLLRARFGEEFEPQDMNDLHPLPSGLLGPITLRSPSSNER